MQLLINDHPVDFAIAEETTVKEAMNSVQNWASERSLIFTGALIDGEMFQPDSFPEKPMHETEIINCYIQSVGDVVIDSIKEGIAYSNRAHQHIKEIKDESLLTHDDYLQLDHGLEWIISVMQSVLNMLGLNRGDLRFKDSTIHEFIQKVQAVQHSLKQNGQVKISEVAGILHDATTLFRVLLISDALKNLVVKSVDSPDVLFKTLETIKEGARQQEANLEEISGLYQKGKDKEALAIVHALIDFLFYYMRTCYQVSSVFGIHLNDVVYNGQTLEELNIKMQEYLNDIADVMEGNDIVSLSDLLEYELRPLIGEIGHFIDSISIQIKS